MASRPHRADGLTSRSIAALSGVSQTTVSRVLSNHPNVSAATRARVLAVLEETGYTPNAAARSMRTRQTGVLGIVVGRVTNPFYAQLAEALHQEITRRTLQMSVWISDGGPRDGGELAALTAVQHRAIDGLIYTTVTDQSPSFRLAVERGAPIVLLNRTLEGAEVDSVDSDNRLGAARAAAHLLELGHRRIGLASSDPGISTAREREAGFRDALADAGVALPATMIARGDFTHAAGRDALRRLRTRRGGPPTAVFCVNDLIAFGVLDGAREAGVRVPEDLSVVGYDDTEMAAWASYGLTTIRQPMEDMARLGVDMLLGRIASPSPDAPRHHHLGGELVVRASTAPPRPGT